jgi:putative CocE/NonD family hydrolase
MPPEPLPGLPGVTVERDVPCRMEDGVTLSVDVYRPADGGPHPVLLTSTPYDKAAAQSVDAYAHPSWYARHGYVVVCQDCRGRYRSEGTFYPFRNEAGDVSRTIEWAAQLPGADGSLATYGFSYAGLNQLLAAQRQPHGLAGMCPAFTAGRPYDEWLYRQGAFSLAFAAAWSTFLAVDVAARRGDDAALGALAAAFGGLPGLYWVLPLDTFPGFARSDAPFYFDWLAHPTNDDYWRSFEVDFASIEVPGFHVAGWWDIFLLGSVRAYTTLASLAKSPQKLVIGPWQHMPWKPVGSAPEHVGSNVVDDWQLRFLDHVLKGRETGIFDSPATVFVMNDGWRDLDGWPPSTSRGIDWYFHSDGRALSSSGDGTLSTEPPQDEPPDLFLYMPGRPVLSAGGHSCCLEIVAPMGPADQQAAERSRLVLVYTSAPLDRDLVLVGDVTATLHAASSATDTDFTVRLCVVDADGRSTNIQEGIVRASHRESLERPAPIVPGDVYEYRIELGPVGIRITAGHRLRVDISSSDFPQWDRNLNTGGGFAKKGPSAVRTATQTVLHDRAHPSRITLPAVS